MHPTICPPEVFLAVARAGSFRRAADSAHPRQAQVRVPDGGGWHHRHRRVEHVCGLSRGVAAPPRAPPRRRRALMRGPLCRGGGSRSEPVGPPRTAGPTGRPRRRHRAAGAGPVLRLAERGGAPASWRAAGPRGRSASRPPSSRRAIRAPASSSSRRAPSRSGRSRCAGATQGVHTPKAREPPSARRPSSTAEGTSPRRSRPSPRAHCSYRAPTCWPCAGAGPRWPWPCWRRSAAVCAASPESRPIWRSARSPNAWPAIWRP